MSRSFRFAAGCVAIATAASACKPPPPAPEGLDDSTSYLVREFWADDALFQAGIQGFMNWFEEEGKDLVGVGATTENTEAFTIGALSDDDIQYLPLDEQVITSWDKGEPVHEDRDISLAAGVVSLAEMDCTIEETLGLLARPDQDTMFPKDWEGYEREYVTERATYEAAMNSRDFTPIPQRVDPFADGFDFEAYDSTLLFTDNQADPTNVLVANLPAYPLDLDFRQGEYLVGEDTLGAFAIITYQPAAVWGPSQANGLIQTYSMEINVERPSGKTLRMLAVWSQPIGSGIEPDDPLALNYAVNKSLNSSNGLSELCAAGAPPEE